MKILNLADFSFLPSESAIPFEAFTFHGGEPHIKLRIGAIPDPTEEVLIAQRIHSSDDFMLLLLATDALRRSGFKKISAFLPYFPAARQDRVMVPGEPLSVKVYAQIVNAQHYERVIVFDPHSDTTPALLDNVQVLTNEPFVKRVLEKLALPDLFLVAPDAGAAKKINALATKLNIQRVISCEKMRDVRSGAISGFVAHTDNLHNCPCLILDDICDGGGTFIGISQALKKANAGKIFLAVSHGIFSKGTKDLCEVLDGIFSTDSFSEMRNENVVTIRMNSFYTPIN